MLTEKQLQILRRLYMHSRSLKVYSTHLTQETLAKELGISRQALSLHLKKLREAGYLRTGRGFIDLTDKALAEIGLPAKEAFVIIKSMPSSRKRVFKEILELKPERLYRVTGEIDIIAVLPVERLKNFLDQVSGISGVEKLTTHVVIEMHQV